MMNDLNRREKKLRRAIQQGDLPRVKELVRGASLFGTRVRLQAVDENNMTAFMLACQSGQTDIVEYWLKEVRFGVDGYNKDGQNALMLAVMNGHIDTVKVLLADENNDFYEWKSGTRLPDKEVIYDNMELWKCLRDAGAKKLIALVEKDGSFEEIQKLISDNPYVDIDVDMSDKEGKTPLMVAITKGDIAKTFELCELGADVNEQDNRGWTPLTYALNAYPIQMPIVCYLVENGADIAHKVNVKPYSSFHHSNRLISLVTMVKERGYKRDEEVIDYLEGKSDMMPPQKSVAQDINMSPEEVAENLRKNKAFLNKLILAGQLVEVFELFSYKDSLQLYGVLQSKLPEKTQEQVENVIRQKREMQRKEK